MFAAPADYLHEDFTKSTGAKNKKKPGLIGKTKHDLIAAGPTAHTGFLYM